MVFLIFGALLYLFIDLGRAKRESERRNDALARLVDVLEHEQEKLRVRITLLEASPAAAPAAQDAVVAAPQVIVPAPQQAEAATAPPPTEEPSAVPETLPPAVSGLHEVAPEPPPPPPEPVLAPATPAWLLATKKWLFTGNLVAKFGLMILFIGISFLLKYAAERFTVPIELRFAGVVLADIGLLTWGWRIRTARRGIGLPVQGAALGILMLTTFAAFARFHLLPSGLAFGMLFTLTAFTCMLAVLQDAIWLAVFGIVGGFAAPVLTSTGQGSHIGLFSYYAVLNAGILAIALKKSWRSLNLLGFAFTFVVGTAWGVLKYEPENYLSAQVFLTLFVCFYVGIAVAYADRQAPRLKHYVDATLVFGTPILGFGLQFGLVQHMRFGLAIAALALGLFYTGLALLLWRRRGSNLRLLVESFLAMGVVFGTLALPFALDQRWTSGAWAIEGAALVWIGLRQKNVLTWSFGLLVQAGAWLAFLGAMAQLDPAQAAQANIWLGFLLLTAAAFAMAINFREAGTGGGERASRFTITSNVFLGFAALWLLGGAWGEIFLRFNALASHAPNLLVVSAMVCALVLYVIAAYMQWLVARAFAVVAQLAGGLSLLLLMGSEMSLDGGRYHAFAGAAMIMAGALVSSRRFYLLDAPRYRTASYLLMGWAGWWCFGPILQIAADWASDFAWLPSRGADYQIAVALTSILFARLSARLAWPQLRWLSTPCWLALLVQTATILYWMTIDRFPGPYRWTAFLALWLASEYLLHFWQARAWNLSRPAMKLLHLVRIAGPWAMIWHVGAELVGNWLYGLAPDQTVVLASAGWQVSGSWLHYLPAWLMMGVLSWLTGRSRRDVWPVQPLARWHRIVLIPLGTGWALLLALVWNLRQDGTMAPLPYLPILNPLDLTTGFAAIQAVLCYRMLRTGFPGAPSAGPRLIDGLPRAAGFAAYGWFNLMLLRTAARYLDIDYAFGALAASQFVQAMLSLTWCITSLILMRRARSLTPRPRLWMLGAALLGVVVTKLFLADLANVGSMARIVSFVGVGALMVAIGYLAPYPSRPADPTPVPV
ncbi:DUF2339 domain-containing protein [Massilia sp. R2A-15]|uniref:DUF2339 domain-containing protein n=1 Tax=Massilia sp. R2A-15 TaxID=3064278 RepID=UPI0027365601|nr:DUF2339 domain-containing protein [Massilia sp. R2A-15]WLI88350.1 DUF2339 domain-containing protein [Massilia sp. R2A-15]